MHTKWISAVMALAVLVFQSIPAAAQQTEIEGTISSQIEAFKSDDFDTAFTFASPNLQMMFQSPENFRRMVTESYPMVWRPAEVRYLDLREYGGSMFQKVQITDGKGFVHLLLYQMIQTDDGWRIASVQMLDAPGVNA